MKGEPYKTIIPVFFHNLREYNSHLIMQVISGMKENLSCIANNMEKNFSFSLGRQIRFLDSLQFLNASLDDLINLSNDIPFKLFWISSYYQPFFDSRTASTMLFIDTCFIFAKRIVGRNNSYSIANKIKKIIIERNLDLWP